MNPKLTSPLSPLRPALLPSSRLPSFLPQNLRIWKRRRLKVLPRCCAPIPSPISIEGLFRGLITAFPSVNSLEVLIPALGFVAGTALYLASGRQRGPHVTSFDSAGEWVLFCNPTPFNQSVFLRCPSLAFEYGGELLDGVNEQLVMREMRDVRSSKGRIPACKLGDGCGNNDEIEYQRICVGTDDGGVIALDWPENLDLEKEQGLDTTVMLVPGSTEGSMDREVRAFVYLALRCGFFPIVMNPRGCAGSPLTTPRLFTAGDSDDVCTAVQFIKGARPWTTLMSVGWGYGANMLTKYLGEFGEQTPLTAAICLNNPFDMNEASKPYPSLVHDDQKLVGGLQNILEANKVIFQGKTKGFNVARALSATSIRIFDVALSMISYGFKSVEEFYSWSSSTKSVVNIKIPLLFIQSNDSNVPFYTVPRGSIIENPFTSLLSCYSSSTTIYDEASTFLWCQHLTIEWLQAVELALLKGRHPILKDVDISLNPSRSFSPLGSKILDKSIYSWSRSAKNYMPSILNKENGKQFLSPSHSDESDNIVESLTEQERSQMLATGEVVLSMFDVTAPGSLDDMQRKKVMRAIEEGESLMKALEGAVPEQVRGKLTSAISEIIQTQGRNTNLGRLLKHGWRKTALHERKMPTVDPDSTQNQEPNSNTIEKSDGSVHSCPESSSTGTSDLQVIESAKSGLKVGNGSTDTDKNADAFEENYARKNRSENGALGMNQDDGCLVGEETVDSNIDDEEEASDYEKSMPDVSVVSEDFSPSSLFDNGREWEDVPISEGQSDQSIFSQDEDRSLSKGESRSYQDNIHRNEERSSYKAEEGSPYLSSGPPPINVSEALDAFKSFDDSTQMAVNSVFGVIENVIDQLEKKTERNGRKGESEDKKYFKGKSEEKKDPDSDGYDASNLKSLQTESDTHQLKANRDSNRCSDLNESVSREHVNDLKDTENNERLNDESCLFNKESLYKSLGDNRNADRHEVEKFPLQLSKDAYLESAYRSYLQRYFLEHMSDMKSYNSRPTADLFLDHEKGYWKMLDYVGNHKYSIQKVVKEHSIDQNEQQIWSRLKEINNEKIIDTSYTLVNGKNTYVDKQSTEECEISSYGDDHCVISNAQTEKIMQLVKTTILDVLEVELRRKLGLSNMDDIDQNIEFEMQTVANKVALDLLKNGDFTSSLEETGVNTIKFGTIQAGLIVNIISSAMQLADRLKAILPSGVIVGSSLACLGKYFYISSASEDKQDEAIHHVNKQEAMNCEKGSDVYMTEHLEDNLHDIEHQVNNESDTVNSCRSDIMVGNFSDVLGSSDLFTHQKRDEGESRESNIRMLARPDKGSSGITKEQHDTEKKKHDDDKIDPVSDLTEKAISVASPLIPIKSESKVDQERLLTILAELGQKGGLLKFLGNIALLWGGIRGALSLNDRLIKFLRIAERPLIHRVLGFVCMALLIWSPVVIPLMPHMVHSWTTKQSMGIAGYTCLFSLHVAVLILIILWGKRIRGYEFPLEQYGLTLISSAKVQTFAVGLIGGILLVVGVHSINVSLAYACFTRPSIFPPKYAGILMLLKAYAKLLFLAVRGITTATCVATVEELLFRSWLPDEIAADLGYHKAILISGIAFAILQRSLSSIPGSLFLSLALFGAKQRNGGSLLVPIGIRTGIMATNFLLKTACFVSYKPGCPVWLGSAHPWHPFDGATGLILTIVMAIFLYPQQSLDGRKAPGIRE